MKRKKNRQCIDLTLPISPRGACTAAVDSNNDGLCTNVNNIGQVGDPSSETTFYWTNLVISRGIQAPDGDSGSDDCEIGTQNKITNKKTGESYCIDIGTTGNDDNPDPKMSQ